jgi:hypothetical protein
MQPTPQDDQLMSKQRVLGFKPQLRLEWRGQDGQNETEQPDHSANLGVSITASTRKRFSVHTANVVRRFTENGRFLPSDKTKGMLRDLEHGAVVTANPQRPMSAAEGTH